MKKLMLALAACAAMCGAKADTVGSLKAEGEGLTFKEQGAFEIYQWEGADSTGTFIVPEGGATVDLLLVGGGGAGGFCRGGGGGGGGVIYKQSYALDAGSYTVTVGAGGVPDAWTPTSSDDPYKNSGSSTEGTDGKSSVLSKATETVFEAFGGGGGGTFISGQNPAFSQYGSSSAGRTGASAGGSANRQGSVAADGFGQGNAGGAAWSGGDASSGGGGGASAAGGSASAKELAGDGGAGYECPITGTLIAYGGGGGAGLYSGTAGAGGAGGGGHGGNQGSGGQNAGMTAGVDGLGGGGGGASGAGNKWVACGGGKGGSGVVVVRCQKAGAMALNVQVDAGNARELDVTASVTASDGAETDTFDVYLACSDSDENFDYAKVGEGVALNAEVSKAFVGLDSDSLYYVAAKAYNRTTGTWSEPLVSQWRTSAAESPVQIMGPGITKTETGYEVFVRIDHFQGNVSDCTLTYNGEAKAVTGVGTYTWQVGSAADDFSATVDLAYQAGGISYEKKITQKTSGGASVHIADFATLDESFFFEGDRILLPEGNYTVFGDAIATVSGNVVYCKKSGFTLLYDGVSDYRVCVVPHPPAGGDVFYYFSNNGNGDPWTSATWTKVTQNTERTYPNNVNDIAVVEGGCTWAKMLINDDISLHGYVVGVARTITSGDGWVQLETTNGKTLTFCGSEEAPALFGLSSMSTRTCRIRLGRENGTGDNVLNVNVSGRLNFDWCGDSVVVPSQRNAGQIQWCSAIVTVPEGSTLAFVNDSKVVIDSIVKGGTAVGHIAGAGTVVFGQSGGIPLSFLKFAGDEFAGDVAIRAGEWKGMVEFPDSDLTVFDAPNAGRKTIGIGYDLCTSNPGRSQIDAKSVTLDGGCLKIYRNYAENSNLTPWTEGATTDEERVARLTVTNEIKKLIVKGDSAFYCECSYGTTRVRQHLILDEIEHDKTGTLCLYDFNFRDKGQRLDPLHYDRVKGRGLAAYAVGRDPQEGDPQTVYKIIPWMACTVNDNGYQIYNTWGAQMNFPALVNGELKDVYGRTSSDLSKVGEWDNVFFTQKGISALGGKTIHSFAYDTGETAPYPGNLVLGAGKTLTIKSGGLIMARTGRWLGCTQTAKFAENGSVAFGGERAYVICDFGKPEGSGGSREYDVIWTSMVAPNGLTKGGCGELVFATDQRGIDGDIVIGGGTLWLGHPANYRKDGWLYENQSDTIPVRGCATDVEAFTLRPGAVLAIPSKGYDIDGNGAVDDGETAISKNAVITLVDNAAGSSKVEIAAGADQTCKKLYISGKNKGKALKRGTYGASGSEAMYIDDDHFAGTGVLTVRKDDSSGMVIVVE